MKYMTLMAVTQVMSIIAFIFTAPNASLYVISYTLTINCLFITGGFFGLSAKKPNGFIQERSINKIIRIGLALSMLATIWQAYIFFHQSSIMELVNEISLTGYRDTITHPEKIDIKITNFSGYFVFAFSIYLIITAENKNRLYYIGFVGAFIYSCLTVSRSRLMDIGIALLTRKEKKSKALAISALIIIVIILGEMLGRHANEFTSSETSESLTGSFINIIWHLLYRIGNPLYVFQEVYFEKNIHSIVPLSIYPLSMIIEKTLIEGLPSSYILYQQNPISGWFGYVTPGFSGFLYIDFGLYGSAIASLVFGYIFGVISHIATSKNPSNKSSLASFIATNFAIFSFLEMRSIQFSFIILITILFSIKTTER